MMKVQSRVFFGVKVLLGIVFLMMLMGNSYAQIHELPNGIVVLENFQQDTVGHLPYNWYDRNGDTKTQFFSPAQREKFKYQIKQQGKNKYLEYSGMEAQHLNLPLVNQKQINIKKTPILSWKWRVWQIPKNGDENVSKRNDSAAGIYVVWGFTSVFKIPKSVKYAWSSTLPVGTILSKNFNNQKIVILATDSKNLGKWITFRRNIYQDYKNLFGEDPPERPIAILILSDGDSTHSHVRADYDDLELRPVNMQRAPDDDN